MSMYQTSNRVCTCKIAGAAAEGHSSIGASGQDTFIGSHRQKQAEGYNPGCDEQKAEDILQAVERIPPEMQQPQYIAQDEEPCASESPFSMVRTCTTIHMTACNVQSPQGYMQCTAYACVHALNYPYMVACNAFCKLCMRRGDHTPMLPAVIGVHNCMKGYFCSWPR